LQQLGIGLGLDSGAARNELRNAIGLATFGAYLFESKLSEEQRGIPHALLRARRYINEQFAHEITLAQLADVAALTPTHLVAAFGKHFGTTPVRYLWSVRAEHARRLLLHTGLPSAEIAFRCGYKSPYHFSRHIKQSFGMAPTALRDSKAYRPPSNALEAVSDIEF
jgi:AraC family L-rhamnose operon regulatory protein RhaS